MEQRIEQLQEHYQSKLQQYMEEHQRMVDELRDGKAALEMDLATRDSELAQERQLKEDLLRHTEEVSKYREYEKRANDMQKNCEKLKNVYAKLREEHIALLREKADVERQLAQARHSAESVNRLKEEIERLLAERAQAEEKETLVKELRSGKERVEADNQVSCFCSYFFSNECLLFFFLLIIGNGLLQGGGILILEARVDNFDFLNFAPKFVDLFLQDNFPPKFNFYIWILWFKALEAKLEWITKEKSDIESDLQDLLAQKQAMEKRVEEAVQAHVDAISACRKQILDKAGILKKIL